VNVRRSARLGSLALLLFSAAWATPAAAVSPSLWDPGLIISDQAFYNGSAMSASEVQRFLDDRVPACQDGYTCLKDYRQDTPSIPADQYCRGYTGAANERASDIIAKVGASCNISQKAILVTLQKEMSLVTHTWPSDWRFDRAMGFACPDSAACDPNYRGFVYQVYYGSRQFQKYAANPTSYNYQAGRVNNILFHPNTACGYSSVYIANKATAGLYNYTPYQPNAAAVANPTGTGDSCSSYGNRNFWRFYWDWFGSPVTSNVLLRTVDRPTVYLISGTTKHPITTYDAYVSLLPLGGLGYVSQGYLDGYTTGSPVGRNFRNATGTISLFDRGYFFKYASCDQMVDFGSSCASDQYVQLTDQQFARFTSGPTLTNIIGTLSGGRYSISDGTRAEILDEVSQVDAGLPLDTMIVLSDSAISDLALAEPITRDGVIIKNRDLGTFSLLLGGELHPISAETAASIGSAQRSAGALSTASLALLPSSTVPFTGIALDGTGQAYILTASGRYAIGADLIDVSQALTLPSELIDLWPDLGGVDAFSEGAFVKSPDRPTVYVVTAGTLRPIDSWRTLLALSGDDPISIAVVPSILVASLPHGPAALTPGALVRSPNNPRVYLIDGLGTRVPVMSFAYVIEAGFSSLYYTSDDRIGAYAPSDVNAGFAYQCDGSTYLAAGGSLHYVSPDLEDDYALDPLPLDALTCDQARIGSDAGRFIRTLDGKIYEVVLGEKLPVASWARWLEIHGDEGWLNVNALFAASLPTGSNA